jgi:adenine-specific DNA-methyltransferase
MDFDNSESVFDTPKPTRLIARMLQLATTNASDDVVLDFFAGSGTTGHAVFEMNKADSGNRRFILVQLPEPTGQISFSTISDITKERLRRAGKKIREENPLCAGDLGFCVFKLASSNIRAWEPDRENLALTLEASVDHLKTDRTEADILFELLLKLGLDLTVPIEQKAIAGKTVHGIGAGTLLVCLAPQITREEVEPVALGIVDWHKALAPAGESTLVFRDSAFVDDVAKTNLTAILQQHGLDNVRSL